MNQMMSEKKKFPTHQLQVMIPLNGRPKVRKKLKRIVVSVESNAHRLNLTSVNLIFTTLSLRDFFRIVFGTIQITGTLSYHQLHLGSKLFHRIDTLLLSWPSRRLHLLRTFQTHEQSYHRTALNHQQPQLPLETMKKCRLIVWTVLPISVTNAHLLLPSRTLNHSAITWRPTYWKVQTVIWADQDTSLVPIVEILFPQTMKLT